GSHRGVAEQLVVDVRDATVAAGERERAQGRGPGGALPAGLERVGLAGVDDRLEQRDGRLRVARHVDLDLEVRRRGLGGSLADRLEQARPQRAERELVEQDTDLVVVPRSLGEVGRSDPELDVATKPRDLPVEEDARTAIREVLTLPGRELVEV